MKLNLRNVAFGILSCAVIAASSPQRPEFEVASVRENTSNGTPDLGLPR
jgi:hypothetical protein